MKDGNPSVGLHFFTILLIFPMSHVSHMLQGLMTSNLISSKFILSSRLITLQCCMSYTETRTHSRKFVIMHYKKYNARNLRDFQTKIHHVTNERKTMCDACYSEIRPAPPMSLSPITRYAYLRGEGYQIFQGIESSMSYLSLGFNDHQDIRPVLIKISRAKII